MNIIERMKNGEKIVIGMIHCQPLPGSFHYGGNFREISDRAIADARTMQAAGFDAVILENTCDAPTAAKLDVPQIAGLSAVAARVRDAVDMPLGVEAVFNDYAAALSIAIAADAQFIRLPVFVDTVITASGVISPCSREAVLLRKSLGVEHIKILADVQSKHSYLLNPEITLEESAAWAATRGADAIVVTGAATGKQTSTAALDGVRRAVKLPVLAGSGVSAKNAHEQLAVADGLIVGSSLKKGGNLLAPIEADLAQQMADLVKNYR